MGWLNSLVQKIAGAAPTDWTLVDNLPDPGLNIAGKSVVPDRCYVEVYVESMRLEKARSFATTFNAVVYSFVSLARNGMNRVELASVTKANHLAELDSTHLDRVITVSKRIVKAIPWRGDPFGLELGLFSVKSGNLLTQLINFTVKLSDKVGISSAAKASPFGSLITEGLDMIAGQTQDTKLELAIDTDLALNQSCLVALIAKPKSSFDASKLSIDGRDRKLLYQNEPLESAYCVFSIRCTDRNAEWGAIPALQEAYAEFVQGILSGKHQEAEEALTAFHRQLIVSPDLISADKQTLWASAQADLQEAFPGGGQASDREELRHRFQNRHLADLHLYGTPEVTGTSG